MRAGWMRPSAISALERESGDLAAEGIVAGDDDGLGRVVDDEVHAGVPARARRMFRPSRPMIRPFMSSDGRSTMDTAVSTV